MDVALLLEHREDVAGGILEPRDRRPAAAEDALLVRLELALVALEAHAGLRQPGDGVVDVLDREVEHREARRRVVLLRIDEDRSPAAELQVEHAVLLGDVEAERLAVELLRPRYVVGGEA